MSKEPKSFTQYEGKNKLYRFRYSDKTYYRYGLYYKISIIKRDIVKFGGND